MDEEKLKKNVSKQLRMNPVSFGWLQESGLKPDAEVQLDFFYNAPNREKALQLKEHIAHETDYKVEAASDGILKKKWSVSGKTQSAKISLDILNDWVIWMCKAGAQFDCEFDGWGTRPS